jgi:hypothetical protein
MNRQEAIAELKRMASTIEWDYPLDAQIAIEKAVEALSGPTPDPDTGLVACGCGGKAVCEPYWFPERDDDEWHCFCNECGVMTMRTETSEGAREEWNTAMGYTAPSRPGAIVPDAGEMAPNGDEGVRE